MRMRRILILLTLAAVALSVPERSFARSDRSWEPPRPVRLESTEEWGSFFPSWGNWMSAGVEGAGGGLLLRDGDLIYGDDGVSLVYLTSDGTVLRPTKEEWGTLLAGEAVSLSLKEGLGGREWLESASAADLATIRLVDLPDELDVAYLPALKRLAAASPRAALIVGSTATLFQVLPLFKPRLLGLDDVLRPDARKVLADQKQLDTLFISGKEPGSLDLLPMLPRLRRLAISNWDVEEAGPLPPGLRGLKSLAVTGDQLKDLSALAGLKKLRWLGLPPMISQEQFAAVIKAHPCGRVQRQRHQPSRERLRESAGFR